MDNSEVFAWQQQNNATFSRRWSEDSEHGENLYDLSSILLIGYSIVSHKNVLLFWTATPMFLGGFVHFFVPMNTMTEYTLWSYKIYTILLCV